LEEKGRWYKKYVRKGEREVSDKRCEKDENFLFFFKVAGGNKGVVVQLYCLPFLFIFLLSLFLQMRVIWAGLKGYSDICIILFSSRLGHDFSK
jgi:hypothetical protein